MDIQSIVAVLFLFFLGGFILHQRKKIVVQKLIFPILYVVLYRTKLGLSQMQSWANRHPQFWYGFGVCSVWIGFIGMAAICAMLLHSLYQFIVSPAAVPGVALVLPFKAKGTFYVPFFYWILTIFIIAVVHEFCHGVLSCAHKIPIKSSGFAFLSVLIPVLPAAFVEPEEKILAKKKPMQQLAVFAAGPVSNLATAAMVILLMVVILNPLAAKLFIPTGVTIQAFSNTTEGKYPAEISGMQQGDLITHIDGVVIKEVKDFTSFLSGTNAGQQVTVITNRSPYTFALAQHPDDKSKSYMGVYVAQATEHHPAIQKKYGALPFSVVGWVTGLFFWLYVLSLGIGLFNLLPLGPIDGGRMLKTALGAFMHEKKAHQWWKYISLFFLALILLNLGIGFFA